MPVYPDHIPFTEELYDAIEKKLIERNLYFSDLDKQLGFCKRYVQRSFERLQLFGHSKINKEAHKKILGWLED